LHALAREAVDGPLPVWFVRHAASPAGLDAVSGVAPVAQPAGTDDALTRFGNSQGLMS
jgi:hypothetical protein